MDIASAIDSGVMARRYGFPRDACRKPAAYKNLWQSGWDEENARRTQSDDASRKRKG
jgi:hypothetical protein